MRKPFTHIKRKIILHAPLLLLLTLSIAITNVSAGVSPYSPADAISVDPPTVLTPAIGENVTVTITITNITGCAGYMFKLDYNSTILNMTSWTFDTDPANPLTATQMAPDSVDRLDTDASAPGSVKLSTVWKAGVAPYTYSGDSVAANITFEGLMIGISNVSFDETWTRACDDMGDDILFTELIDTEIEVVPEFPAAIIMPLLLTATLAAAILAKIVWSKKRRS